nr:hypothetical protein [Tanacetum cinerariifolium]
MRDEAKVKTINGEEQIQTLVDKKKVIITETSVRSDLHLKDDKATECLPTATIFEQLTLTGFVEVFLDSQVKGMLKHKEIYVTPSHTKNKFANIKRHGKDFSSKVTPLFETMMVQPQKDIGEDLKIPTDSHHTPTVTQPSTSSQPQQKQNFKKSKKKIHEVPQLSDSTHDVADEHVTTTSNDPLLGDMFDTSVLDDEEVVAEKEVSTADPVPTGCKVVTTADLIDIKTSNPKAKGIVIKEPSEKNTPTPTDSSQQLSMDKDKGKAKMIEPKKPLKRKDHIMIDEEVAKNFKAQIQAKLEEEKRLARKKKKEDNIDLIESWDKTQAMLDADYELATKLQEEERGELSIEEKSKLFVQLLDVRKKHFATLRAKEKKRKPPTKAQKRNQMCTYLKNMENYKNNQLKNKFFKEIHMLFNNTMKWIESFVPMDTELVKGSEKVVSTSSIMLLMLVTTISIY